MFCFFVQTADPLSFIAGMEAPISSYSANLLAILELILINSEVSCLNAQTDICFGHICRDQKAEEFKDKI